MNPLIRFFLTLTIPFLLPTCNSSHSSYVVGLAPGKTAYIPARTAVIPCRQWPSFARFRGTDALGASAEGFEALCPAFDSFVIEGFRNQPYMKGYSPTSVKKFLGATEALANHLDDFEKSWQPQPSDCSDCANFVSYYAASIAGRPDWRRWLNTLSQGTNNSDAVLIPFILEAKEEHRNDRGMLLAVNRASVALLLVDSNNGSVIWSGARDGEQAASALGGSPEQKFPKFPGWKSLSERILTEMLWKDFPGRLIQ